MEIFISIIIPVHNRAHTLTKCVDSILSQSYKQFELILIDDHSTDNSVIIAQDYAKKDVRVKVIIQEPSKKGAQAARNTGIINSRYEWIMFNDSDDIWDKDKIIKEIKILSEKKYNDSIVIYSDCNLVQYETNEKKYWALPHISEKKSYKDLLIQSGPMFQSILCSKKQLEKINLLDESVPSYQEWDTSIRLAKNCKFVHIKEPLFDYYIGGNDTISKSVEKDFIGRCNIYNKFKNEIIIQHGVKKYKQLISENLCNNQNSLYLNQLKETNPIISLYEKNLVEFLGSNYFVESKKYIKNNNIKNIINKYLQILKRFIKFIIRYKK